MLDWNCNKHELICHPKIHHDYFLYRLFLTWWVFITLLEFLLCAGSTSQKAKRVCKDTNLIYILTPIRKSALILHFIIFVLINFDNLLIEMYHLLYYHSSNSVWNNCIKTSRGYRVKPKRSITATKNSRHLILAKHKSQESRDKLFVRSLILLAWETSFCVLVFILKIFSYTKISRFKWYVQGISFMRASTH